MNDLIASQGPKELERPATSFNDGPDSLVSMLPPKVQEMVKLAYEKHPELFNKSESELFQYLRAEQGTPTPSDNRLRIKFWMEYDHARLRGETKLRVDNIIAGLTYREYFYSHYIVHPMKLAWMLCMPVGYQVKTLEALEFGIDRMRSILDMDHMVNGKPAIGILQLKQKIVEMMHDWVKGAPVQRQLSVQVQTARHAEMISADLSTQELERQLAALEIRNRAAKNLPIDITPAEMGD